MSVQNGGMEIELVRGTRRRKHVEAVLVGDRLRVSFPRWMSLAEAGHDRPRARRSHAAPGRSVAHRRRGARPAAGPRVRAAAAPGRALVGAAAVTLGIVHARGPGHPRVLAAGRLPGVGARLRARPRARAPRRGPPRPGARRARRPVSARRTGARLPDRQGPRSRRARGGDVRRGWSTTSDPEFPIRAIVRTIPAHAVPPAADERGRDDRARPEAPLVVLLPPDRRRDRAVRRDHLPVRRARQRVAHGDDVGLGARRDRVGDLARCRPSSTGSSRTSSSPTTGSSIRTGVLVEARRRDPAGARRTTSTSTRGSGSG